MLFNLLENKTPESNVGSIVLMIVLVVAVIGLFVWQTISGKKKQKEAQSMVNALKKGDKVKTIGGICGYVVEINDAENTFVLETGTDKDKSYVKFDKGAIYQTAPAKEEETVAKEEVKEEAPAEKKAPAKKKTAKKAEKPAEEVEAPAEGNTEDKE